MAAGGPTKLKRSDFSAKEIHIFTQMYDKIRSGELTKERVAFNFRDKPVILQRYNAFTDVLKDEAAARIVDSCGQIALILSKSVSGRKNTIEDARAGASSTIVRESNNLSISPPKP